MNILCLYANECVLELLSWLKEQGNHIVLWKDRIDIHWLDAAVKELFKEVYKNYKFWDSMRKKCLGVGTYHKESDLQKIVESFDDWNYDINVESFREHVKKYVICK